MPNPFDSTNLQNIPVRPLTKGMFQNIATNGIPPGGFWRTQNYHVTEQGLERRGGFREEDTNINTGDNKYDEQLFDMIYFYNRDPSVGPEQLLLTSSKLYSMRGADGNVEMAYTSVNTAILSNTATDATGRYTVTVAGTQALSDRIRYIDRVSINGVSVDFLVSEYVDPSLVLTIEGTTTLDALVGDIVIIKELFYSEEGLGPQYAVLPSVGPTTEDKIVIADQGGRGLYEYSRGGGLAPFVVDATDGITSTEYFQGGKTVTYFDDRLWVGNTEEVDGEYRQRIRWSDAVNFDRIRPESYTDLPYGESQLLRLVPLGSMLVAYYVDAIYIGRRTQMQGQPYYFERIETGVNGLTNARAVVRHTDKHYLVAQDDIYMLSGAGGFQPIGQPILEEALFFTKKLELKGNIQVEHDPETQSIVFLFPDTREVGLTIEKNVATRLWRYYYRVNAWAYDEVNFADSEKTVPNYLFSAILPSKTYVYGRSWEDWADLEADASWDGTADPGGAVDSDEPPIGGDASRPAATGAEPTESFESWGTWTNLADAQKLGTSLKIGIWSAPLLKQVIVKEFSDAEQDTIGTFDYPIWSLIESGDSDTGIPDYTKTVTRLSVKAVNIYSERTSSLSDVGGIFSLYLSAAMGYKWKRPLTLRFKRNYNEGYANFRATGSTFRFKLINSQVIAQYRISEYVLRMVGRGLQVEN